MIPINYPLLSVITGFIFGIIYGLFFVYQRRTVLLSFNQKISTFKKYFLLIGFALVRLTFLGTALLYALQSSYLSFLLFIVTFFIGFWLNIYISKAKYGRI